MAVGGTTKKREKKNHTTHFDGEEEITRKFATFAKRERRGMLLYSEFGGGRKEHLVQGKNCSSRGGNRGEEGAEVALYF